MDTYSIKSPYVFLFFKVLLKYLSDTYTCTVEEIKDLTVPSVLTTVWEGQVVDPTTSKSLRHSTARVDKIFC